MAKILVVAALTSVLVCVLISGSKRYFTEGKRATYLCVAIKELKYTARLRASTLLSKQLAYLSTSDVTIMKRRI